MAEKGYQKELWGDRAAGADDQAIMYWSGQTAQEWDQGRTQEWGTAIEVSSQKKRCI